jgi:PPP family 3-phenylpropionic acid transporter
LRRGPPRAAGPRHGSPTLSEGLPYWRLSGFYFYYFATLGALIPYWGLYLKSLGFGPEAIGQLMAVLMGTKIVAPNVWGFIADRRGQRLAVVRWASSLSAIGFAGVYLGAQFWTLAVTMAVFSFFWNASLPQFEALTLTHLGAQAQRYTRIRLWGSVGFIVTVVLLGTGVDKAGAWILPHAILLLMIGIWLSSLLVPDRGAASTHHDHEPLWRVLRRPKVIALLTVCFLMQASHGPFYAFYSIYLKDYGYTTGLIGTLWSLGVVAEVLVFLAMHRLLERFGMRKLFLTCFALTSARWVIVALFPTSVVLQAAAQSLHAASFGIYHAVAIQLFHVFFVGRLQGRGQALYSSVSFGAGGALGSLASGYLWERQGPEVTYLLAAVVSGIAFMVIWRWLRGEQV